MSTAKKTTKARKRGRVVVLVCSCCGNEIRRRAGAGYLTRCYSCEDLRCQLVEVALKELLARGTDSNSLVAGEAVRVADVTLAAMYPSAKLTADTRALVDAVRALPFDQAGALYPCAAKLVALRDALLALDGDA